MKQNEIESLPLLRKENYENMFNVYQYGEDKMYYYNLLQTIVFPDNLPTNLFYIYDIVAGDTWPFISYKNYGSPNLWWAIMYANGILNPVKNPKPGTSIKIAKSEVVSQILIQLGKK